MPERHAHKFAGGLSLSEAVLRRRVYNEEVNRRLQQNTILRELDPYVDAEKISIDVGAATGHITNWLAPRSKVVFSFEAVEPVFAQLKLMTERHKNMIAVHLAIGDHDGAQEFYVDDKRLSNSGFQNLVNGPKLLVETARLDTIFDEGSPIGFIKIDVEGSELDVLLGAERIISESKPNLMVEIYEPYTAVPLGEIFQHLFDRDYKCAYFDNGLVEVPDVDAGIHAVKTKHKAHDGDFLFYA